MKAVSLSTLLAAIAVLAACSPDRSLDTGTPKPPTYCPCEIPPPPPPSLQPNLF